MKTSLQSLYIQVEELNKKIALIKQYEEGFSSVHHNDIHSQTVQSLALRCSSTLIGVNTNVTKLSNIMEVTFKE